MPQANTYNQYGFGYGGFGQTDAATPQSAVAGQTPAAGGAVAASQAAASTQPGQAQWGAADPNSFYNQNYWGG